jgi:hypothetical protein
MRTRLLLVWKGTHDLSIITRNDIIVANIKSFEVAIQYIAQISTSTPITGSIYLDNPVTPG